MGMGVSKMTITASPCHRKENRPCQLAEEFPKPDVIRCAAPRPVAASRQRLAEQHHLIGSKHSERCTQERAGAGIPCGYRPVREIGGTA